MKKIWATATLAFLTIITVCLVRLPEVHLIIAFWVIVGATAIGIVVAGVLCAMILQGWLLHREQTQGNLNDAKVISVLGMRNRVMGRRGRANLTSMPELVSGEYQTVEIE